jgi:helicase MOV-10
LASIFHLLEISTDHRILVCTPSHTAADVVTQRLSKRLSRAHLFRLVDPQRPIETLPPAILPHCRQDDQTGAFSLPHCDELFGFRVIVCTCSDASILYNLGFTNQQLGQQRACFAHQSLQLSQRLRLPSPPSEWALRCPVFTHLFVDEAAQATEPELAISLSVVVDNEAPFCEIGLVGDPRQLSPNIYCKKAADGGLEYSYMERLLRRPMNYLSGGFPFMLGNEDDVLLDLQQHRSCVFLTANYRGHVSFLMMPSALFYFDRLQVASTQTIESERYWIHKVQCLQNLAEPTTELALAWNQMPPSMFQTSQWSSVNPNMLQVRHQEWPIHFRGVKGKDKSVSVDSLAGSSSWSNPEEASAVVEIVATLVREGVASHGIGIMSPFRGQVVLIRKLLRERSMAGVDVGTVEDYQAVERVVTVLSLTRSSEKFLKTDINSRTGIFQQVKRANVALTRAENLLVVVGNPHLMVRDGVWKQFLWFCLRNGLWYGETINPEVLAEMQTKPINVVSYLPGEHHKLLGPADSIENPVVISSIEMALRRTY